MLVVGLGLRGIAAHLWVIEFGAKVLHVQGLLLVEILLASGVKVAVRPGVLPAGNLWVPIGLSARAPPLAAALAPSRVRQFGALEMRPQQAQGQDTVRFRSSGSPWPREGQWRCCYGSR